MRIVRYVFILLVVSLLLMACASNISNSDIEKLFVSNPNKISNQSKIFLIAGSSRSANFAQEIIDQKNIWLNAGFKANEIACYFSKPNIDDFKNDQDQFRSLSDELSKCRLANKETIFHDISKVSSESKFLYIYITSHGEKPTSVSLSANEKIVPEDLYKLLTDHFSKIPKYLVMQSCYSGGFKDSLSSLSKMTVITASNTDRPSFGCGWGDKRTYFGDAYNRALANIVKDPLKLEWRRLYLAVQKVVEKNEKDENESIPSEPQYFSNYN